MKYGNGFQMRFGSETYVIDVSYVTMLLKNIDIKGGSRGGASKRN